jgi:hypothetical protein
MAFTLLYIRLKQLQKEGNGLGLYVPVVIVIVCFLVFASFKQFQNLQSGYYLVAAIALICIALQYSRNDKSFIYKHLHDPHLQIFSEYAALSLPFSITSIFTKSWYCFPLLLLLLFCIPFFKFSFTRKTVFKNISSIIPATNFEWISGIRKHYISFIILYFLAVAFCWLRILPLFLLWFLTIVIISFHTECESIQVLREGNKLPSKYLLDKLTINSTYLTILYLPLLMINTVFNSELLFINILFFTSQFFLLCFTICFKYSSYIPTKSLIGNSITLAIISVSSALPWVFPIPAILSFFYFAKATKNLKQYLND